MKASNPDIEKYDLIFGLGPACSCTMSLRKALLQHLSFPYDWIGPVENTTAYQHDVRLRAAQIAREFAGEGGEWLKPGDFQHVETPPSAPRECYINTWMQFRFIHDFPLGSDFAAEFPKIEAKYRRRCTRLLELIRQSRRVLLVRIDRPDLCVRTEIDDCHEAVRLLSEKFAPVRFDLLLLRCEHGRDYGHRIETDHGGGVREIVFDYDDYDPTVPKFQPNVSLLARFLAGRYAVRDYRTREERRAKARHDREKAYAKYAVTTWWQYRLAKMRRRLMKHFHYHDGK